MNSLRNSLQGLFRFAPVARTAGSKATTRHISHIQRRFVSYQRFPERGGSRPNSGPYSNFAPFARVQYIWRNYKTIVIVTGAGGGTFYVVNLEEVPVTGRRRFNIVSPENEKALVSDSAYQQTLQEFRGRILPKEHPYTQLVARIVTRLLPSAHGLDGGDWQVHVIDDPNNVNAFVMPGGKVFVFTGIIPIAQDENGLAAVLGHEIAHNVCHHVGERLSRQVFTIAAALLISSVFDISGQIGNSIADLTLTLPNGRTQESEADHIGLLMMAEACYDPRRAPGLWKRMGEFEKRKGGAPPQFLSTHPSSGTRGEAMEKWMPQAMEKYNESECSITARGFDEFRKIADVGRRMPGTMSVLTGGRASRENEDWPF
ncbi:metalloendopeptidase [Lithohypha guttulata]|uniref:metalloendopeptidase n=1 Tax=Lithohypha guttulata TaxID=1690604 RepID=UPI002DDF56ED|nr:metalloendopeptidase [Lithohypha guttulata]